MKRILPPVKDTARFWDKVDRRGECWLWTATRNNIGYGMFHIGSSMYVAHRISYTLLRGPLTPADELDHLCRNRSCVNPDHLEIVDHKTNVLRGKGVGAVNAAKVTCLKGHPFKGQRIRGNGRVERVCAICNSARGRALRATN